VSIEPLGKASSSIYVKIEKGICKEFLVAFAHRLKN
jgi:hypothetical protein